MSSSEIITPYLTDNLESLHKHEGELHSKSVLEINSDPRLKDQLEIIQESLNLIFDLTKSYKSQNDNELSIQYIGIRLFNAIVVSLKLLLSGYYQVSAIVQRDILETGFLLDYFLSNKEKIKEWKKSTNKERLKKFSPRVIREALDKRDGFKGKKRMQAYQLLCEYAAHPTYPGFQLVSPKGLGELGPFFDDKFLRATIEELSLRVPLFVIIYLSHFDDLPTEFLKIRTDFLLHLKSWAEKYLNTDLSHVDLETISEEVDELVSILKL
jgi:hypothetical protein